MTCCNLDSCFIKPLWNFGNCQLNWMIIPIKLNWNIRERTIWGILRIATIKSADAFLSDLNQMVNLYWRYKLSAIRHGHGLWGLSCCQIVIAYRYQQYNQAKLIWSDSALIDLIANSFQTFDTFQWSTANRIGIGDWYDRNGRKEEIAPNLSEIFVFFSCQ